MRNDKETMVSYKMFLGSLLCITACGSHAGAMGNANLESSFSGFYTGLGTGMLTLLTNDAYSVTRNPATRPPTNGRVNFTDSAVLFDGHVGYGKMFNQKTYLGAKASIQYTPLTHTVSGPFSTTSGPTLIVGNNTDVLSVKPIYNINAVLGYEALPSVLPFVEAGVTFGNVDINYQSTRTQSNLTTPSNIAYVLGLKSNKYLTGGNVGIGANYLLNKNWFLSSELIYSYLGKGTVNNSVLVPSTNPVLESHSRTKTNQAVALLASISHLF